MEQETIAGIIFVAMYAVIVSEKIHRTIIAMIGAILMIVMGIMTQETAVHHIDFNTLGLLIGMMIIVAITSKTGLFNFIAVWAAKKAKADPVNLLVYLSLITAVCSAFLDNVTTVLLMVPVTFSITTKLHVDVMPYLLAQVIASNVGGTATLIGDPPNIMIGSENLAIISIINLILITAIFVLLYRKHLTTKPELKALVMQENEWDELKDIPLLRKCLFVLGLVILMFFLHSLTGLESSLIAIAGAFLLLLLVGKEEFVEHAMHGVEWPTIFFFIGLFIAVGGLVETGVIRDLAVQGVNLTGGDVTKTSMLVLWMSAIVSAFLDNIPFVATMIPLIQDMGAMGVSNLEPVWWSLALGACLGGNGTIIGASANVIVAGMAAERGIPMTFVRFMMVGFPLMILTILTSTVYVYLRYLM